MGYLSRTTHPPPAPDARPWFRTAGRSGCGWLAMAPIARSLPCQPPKSPSRRRRWTARSRAGLVHRPIGATLPPDDRCAPVAVAVHVVELLDRVVGQDMGSKSSSSSALLRGGWGWIRLHSSEKRSAFRPSSLARSRSSSRTRRSSCPTALPGGCSSERAPALGEDRAESELMVCAPPVRAGDRLLAECFQITKDRRVRNTATSRRHHRPRG